jgi:hypothetical protein
VFRHEGFVVDQEAAAKAAQEQAAKVAPVGGGSVKGAPQPQKLANCVSAAKRAFKKSSEKARRRRGKARAEGLRSALKKEHRRTASCKRRFA